MVEPKNSDIMHTLGALSEKLDENIVLSKHTNGRVKRLELWKAKIEAVNEYKNDMINKEAAAKPTNSYQDKGAATVWLSEGGQKIFIAIAALITAISVYVATIGGK